MKKEVYQKIADLAKDPIVEFRVCPLSGKEFGIFTSEKAFLERMSPSFAWETFVIPFPTLCPEERQRRRLSHRNDKTLYKWTCASSGKSIISMYSPESLYTVYDQWIWNGDSRDAVEYGREFDFSRTFMEQYQELMIATPRVNLLNYEHENSEYCNLAVKNKNCYLITSSGMNENCLYGYRMTNCKDCVDCANMDTCELCYETTDSWKCFKCSYCLTCNECRDCIWCFDCIGCSDCYGCSWLRNKKYHIHNQPYSKKEYQSKIEWLKKTIKIDIHTLKENAELKPQTQINCEQCYGNNLTNCSNSTLCFETKNLEDCKYCYDIALCKDCQDSHSNDRSELNYEIMWWEKTIKSGFSDLSRFVEDVWYCSYCMDSKHLFGCASVKNKQYCIFNKQYTKQEYEALVPKIIAHMNETGEWGEFFHQSISPYHYEESAASRFMPLAQQEARSYGFRRDENYSQNSFVPSQETVEAKNLPETIETVGEWILSSVILCEASWKPYRILKNELDIYRRLWIPLPRKHPVAREEERIARRPGRVLYIKDWELSVY